MKVIDILKLMDVAGLRVVYYEDDYEDPLWEGSLFDTPYWVADLELDVEKAEFHEPISFRSSLGKEHNNRPGFVIIVKEKEE